MVSRFAAFVIWAAVAASIVFWAMRLLPQGLAVPAQANMVSPAEAYRGDLARIFGAAMAPQDLMPGSAALVTDSRFQLVGVVAPRRPSANAEGLAVIAFDGLPPKTYRVGSVVDGDLVLQGVGARAASLGLRGQPPQVVLELPELPPPATGTLPGPESNAAPSAPPPPMAAPMTAPNPPPQMPRNAPGNRNRLPV